MKEFKRNKETGILEVWEDGKRVGQVITMEDELFGNVKKDKENKEATTNE